jgi:GTP-binding protein HflX
LIERPQSGERALLVHCHFAHAQEGNEDLDEFIALAESACALVVEVVESKRDVPDPKYFIGTGKAEEIQAIVQANDIELVLVNHALSPSQERNLEKLLNVRVCDRAGLILDIFASRARTFEGKLQVELAQLSHLSSRLVRGWTHLERQKGGIGLRGPGETQLETDRRLLRERVKHLQARLEKVKQTRALSRKSRDRNALYTVAVVGYTNAGKSTLFNTLTQDKVYAADQLFATLDPTSRKIELAGVGSVMLVDTVGFIRHLPHALIEAFNATLEETRSADLLLHVIDASDPLRLEKIEQVQQVLEEIGAHELPTIEVFNKIDKLEAPEIFDDSDNNGKTLRMGLSASTGEGLDKLAAAVSSHIQEQIIQTDLIIPPLSGGVRSALYEQGAVLHEAAQDDGSVIISISIRRPILRVILSGTDVVCKEL